MQWICILAGPLTTKSYGNVCAVSLLPQWMQFLHPFALEKIFKYYLDMVYLHFPSVRNAEKLPTGVFVNLDVPEC